MPNNIRYIVFLVCFFLFVLICRFMCSPKQREYTAQKSVICCLTRGFEDKNEYDQLLKRNECLSALDWASKYDHVLFHEGNISKEHQTYIQQHTNLPIRFINIANTFTRKSNPVLNNECNSPKAPFRVGYARMCRFWFVDFWEYVSEYDYMVRFDEDVHLAKSCKDPVEYCATNDMHYLSPFIMTEHPAVVNGLDTFSGHSMDEILRIPGTHTQIIHLPFYMNNPNVMDFIKRTDNVGCILHNRWGDAPLMGILVRDFTPKSQYNFNWKGFRGRHGSHNQMF
jgi:hypothetical protein